jgi:alpha-glucosidase
MHADARTMNASGQRTDGSRRDELIVRAYTGKGASEFTLYEDDGRTVAYQRGEVRTTRLAQISAAKHVTVTVEAAEGEYQGAPDRRDNHVALVTADVLAVQGITLKAGKGKALPLPRYHSRSAFDAARRGWIYVAPKEVLAKSGVQDVALEKRFVFRLAQPGHHVYMPGVWNGTTQAEDRQAVPSGYTDRLACEWGVASLNRAYLPLVVGK